MMSSDVPTGAFLSGGIDSSTIVSLMQSQSNKQIKTFTIGFSKSDFNEAKYAKQIAKHLGTDHTELYFSPKTAMQVIPKLPNIHDEPFSDNSQIPSFFFHNWQKNKLELLSQVMVVMNFFVVIIDIIQLTVGQINLI